MNRIEYWLGGTLEPDNPTYVDRQADRELFQALKEGLFCYVLNCRQMGKSSLSLQTKKRLEEDGYACVVVDLSGTNSKMTEKQFYGVIANKLVRGLGLKPEIDLNQWWRNQELLASINKLELFIDDVVLKRVDRPIVIFIDEIDSILNINEVEAENFFALIRLFYNQRAHDSRYKKITFCLLGVTTPADLIKDKSRTPFNIGRAIDLEGFKIEEVYPLIKGLKCKFDNPQKVMQEILYWTGGQPFLTQKACQIVLCRDNHNNEPIEYFVEKVLREKIIVNGLDEKQDTPQHLRTVKDRLFRDKKITICLLEIYYKLLNGETVVAEFSPAQTELLLSGLVVRKQREIRVNNHIYREVFNKQWIENELKKLRPYTEKFKNWLNSKQIDDSHLLKGNELINALKWAETQILSSIDYTFLKSCQEAEKSRLQQDLAKQKNRGHILAKKNDELNQKNQEAEQILYKAQKNKKIAVRWSLGITSLLVCLSVATISYTQRRLRTTQNQVRIAQIELQGTSIINEIEENEYFGSNSEGISLLSSAMELGQELFSLIGKDELLQGNTSSTILSLHKINSKFLEIKLLQDHQNKSPIRNVIYSPEGKTIASASSDKIIRIWNVATGREIKTFSGHDRSVTSISYSPEGKTIASSSADKTIRIWDVATGRELQVLTGHENSINNVSYSPDGNRIVSASSDKTIRIWDVATGGELQVLTGHTRYVNDVSYSPDGNRIVSASSDKTIRIWDVATSKTLQVLNDHKDSVESVSYSLDGKTIASGSSDSTIRIWDVATGNTLQILSGHEDSVESVSYSLDGKTIASGSTDKTIRIWDAKATLSSELRQFKGHEDSVASVNYSPDGKTLASSSTDKTIRIWDANISSKKLRQFKGHEDSVESVSYSPDGKAIASASWDKTIRVWNVTTGQQLKELRGHQGYVEDVSFSPDGNTLASASSDNTIKIWNVTTGRQLKELRGHTNRVMSINYSPDGKAIASASWDKTIRVWNVTTGQQLKELGGHQGHVVDVSFSPDGKTIASVSSDNTIKIWDLTSRQKPKELRGHQGYVTAVQYSPDEQTIASASADKTIRIWNAIAGQALYILNGHEDKILDLSYSPDGKTIVSASADATVRIWQIPSLSNQLRQGCNNLKKYGYFKESPQELDKLSVCRKYFDR